MLKRVIPMDTDILLRKLKARDFLFPKTNDEGTVIYKIWDLYGVEHTIESTILNKNPITIRITRFVPDESRKGLYNEENVVEILCRNLYEMADAIRELERVEDGKPNSPFDSILKEKDMKFKKKRHWVRVK